MKKKKLFSVLLFLLFLLIATKVQASNASISISPSNPKVGDNVTVTVTASNVNTVTLYAQVSGVVSDTIKLVEGSLSGEPKSFSTSKTYKCSSEGTITVKTTSDSRAILKGKDVDVSASATAVVKANDNNSNNNNGNSNTNQTPSKSSNANLKNLGIRPNDFKGFRSGTTKYDVTVPYEVESVNVYAEVQDPKAQVKGIGAKKLKEGTNVAQVVVTAEDGTTKTYTINIVRNSETDEIIPNVPDENEDKPEKLRLAAIALQNNLNLRLSPEFNSEIFEYTIETEEDIQDLELSGIPNINTATVEIKGNDKLTEIENIITITLSSEGYENVIYKIKLIKKVPEQNEEENKIEAEPIKETTNEINNSEQKNKTMVIIGGAVLVFIILVIIAIIIVRIRKNRRFRRSIL